jgi:hypothetical protein
MSYIFAVMSWPCVPAAVWPAACIDSWQEPNEEMPMRTNKLDQIADRQVQQSRKQAAFGVFMLLLVALFVVSLGAVQRTAAPAPAPAPTASLAEQLAADTVELCGDDDHIIVHGPDEAPLC